MASRFLNSLKINDAYTLPSSDGSNGQFIATDGLGNLSFADPSTSSSASIIYRDNFTGDGTTTAFTLQNSLSDEDQTFIYIDGVYQEKDNYSLNTDVITFTTAPESGHSVEVISISGINVGPTTIYQDNFTGDGVETEFNMAQSVDNEVKTMIYFNGVYQFKGTYTVNGTLITFDTAPSNGVNIEVISIASAAAADYNQKMLFYGKASEAISKGDAIMLGGQEGDHFLLAKATQAAIATNHEYFLGLASQDLAQGEFGYVTEFGKIIEIDTSGYTAGDILWFDAGGSTAGALTTTEPAAPLAKIQVAAVIRSHQNEGVLFIRPTWYHELGEMHDVNITSVADKDLLVWNDTAGYWENSKTVDTLTGNTLSATTLTGTLSTASQTNITSVGTLSSLAVSGNLTVDTNTLYVDATNNRVGVGTSTPDLHLDVNGYALASSGFVGGSSGLSLWSDASALSAGLILNTSGNVGIGATSPSHKLTVDTDTNNDGITLNGSSANLRFNIKNDLVTSGQRAFSMMMSGSYPALIFQALADDYSFVRNVMAIEHSGEVGIGTITPSYTLDVNGSSHSTNSYVDNAIFHTGDTNTYLQFHAQDQFRVVTGGVERLEVNNTQTTVQNVLIANDFVGIGTTSPSAKLHVVGSGENGGILFNVSGQQEHRLYSSANSQFNAVGSSTPIWHWVQYTGVGVTPNYKMTLNNTGLGIGTTSPEDKLHVANGGLRVSTTANSNHLSIKNIQTSTSSTAFEKKIRFLGYNNVEEASIVGLGNQYWGSAYNGLSFRTGTTEKMRITSSGNVGIGTNNPKVLLDIGKNAGADPAPVDEPVILRLSDLGNAATGSGDTTNPWAEIQFYSEDASSGGPAIQAKIATIYDDIYSAGSHIAFYNTATPTNGLSERMRINSSGNVGIGTSSPSSKVHILGSAATLTLGDADASSSSTSTILFKNLDGNSNYRDIAKIKGITGGNGGYGHIAFETAFNNSLSERMRITRDGGVFIGTTSNPTQNGAKTVIGGIGSATSDGLVIGGYASNEMLVLHSRYDQASGGVVFKRGDVGTTNVVGSIRFTSTSTSFNTSSDYRLKENVVPIEGALDRINALKPSRFNFISDADKTVDGFLAHEVAEVVPEAISGEKDAVDEKGNPVYQGIDQSKLVPLLVGAIQEQQEIIEDLKQRILTLENSNNG